MDGLRAMKVDLPHAVRGLTVYYFDDGQPFYTILLNARLDDETQAAAYAHEVAHIECHDFERMFPVDGIEFFRHK